MLRTTELRIDNLVNYTTAKGDVLLNVIEWEDLKWLSEDEQGFNLVHNPIPLTEEWLLRFGFVKEFNADENSDSFYLKDCDDSFYIDYDNSWYIGATSYGYLKGTHYVHQLQNLYFALTGEELTLKQDK